MNNAVSYKFVCNMEPEDKKEKTLKMINAVADCPEELGCTQA